MHYLQSLKEGCPHIHPKNQKDARPLLSRRGQPCNSSWFFARSECKSKAEEEVGGRWQAVQGAWQGLE